MSHRVGSRWNCVLPVVYNNSLSYQENIDQLIYIVNQLREEVKTLGTSILPTNADGTINWGKAGDFAVSNGVDRLEWETIENGNDIEY